MPITSARFVACVRCCAGLAAWATCLATQAPVSGQSGRDELPEGRGKQILESACTTCHDLSEVTKFKGYYTRAQWRDVVVTMVDYGAKVARSDVDVLADYLDEHLGKR